MIIQQDILAFLWNMGEVQIDEFEVFEGKEQNKIEKPQHRVRILQTGANDEYISKLSIYKEKIEEKLNEDFDDWGLTKEWIDWHIEGFDKKDIEKLTEGVDKNLPIDEKLFSVINLERVGIYPEYEDYAIWDFMLDNEFSDQILVVVTDNKGEIVDITWES